ncbi:DNA-binding CsgD family transcriptional regulator/sugar-specific transcriptional regulator TrmB [Streptomyces sp. SAI-208]|uniref:helix-turn-helix transcriptional regulator n=1 Tax=unclassified Streptomyces TaxID=2593676 RepID=UPI002474B1A8|nr:MULTISPECIES: helix-turn-helix transcriptional regulator [unclassified Streptomyces]MDH6549852.1 DNA-binding CsgD family transcriptional regulator/sugar-specific transcriptional regulator TrmB [Streptomyces sp. SAI-041]MDH6568904.1 DNA-binding CsgD family transcriptional regulator/sugar-specific transcriptional regulator TrmB [Streptomyces sp. SAI-117]MDH6586142.1 DNA-binding CsgD family transcriptional regulator/sugar-specific transcriptional regulator TrmB [Streptomyces sp. SAI-133]MDH6608
MTGSHTHGTEELCEAGLDLYTRALREGRVRAAEADRAPCLIDLGLLQPDLGDLRWLRPVTPAFALHRLLRAAEDRIADERRREERLTAVFASLVEIEGPHAAAAGAPAISVLSGLDRIGQAIDRTLANASGEVLTIQPHTSHTHSPAEIHAEALVRDQALLDRGGRIRVLYQHTLRHAPSILARYERLSGDVEARTLDEVTQRLIVVEREVAFIPANKDRTLALEIRHPAIVEFLATAFDRLWRLATPMHPRAVQQPTVNGITPRQRAIAALLVEGHTDAVIADRLGMNIRTARVHIAKLAATLGSESRAQLGYLIGQSGILGQEDTDA